MPVYYGSGTPIEPGAFPAILAIGDSWFWYPLPTGYNLLQQLSDRVLKPDYANILSLGYVGARLEDFVEGKFADEFQEQLRPVNAQYYSAILISGAGNDAVDYALALKNRCSGIGSPGKCFDEARFDALMRSLSGWLGRMIHDIRWAWRDGPVERQPHIFVHCYDYAPPDGKAAQIAGIPLPFGPWLKPAMDEAQVRDDVAFRQDLVKLLIDRIHDTFSAYDDVARRVHLVDSRGCLDLTRDWDNELHPNSKGYRKLADGPWRKVLGQYGFART
ncbi:MAG: hypothetical protein D4R74_03915 [Betaproteobacteria bacterium]|nr:MAG: hypothetical protein D4R74_03915 [Betaproteobacteria bacterium]